jgi:D-alanine-D-alanine ligase
MNRKYQVAVVMGGYSSEWEISIKTGQNVVKDLDPQVFDIYPVILRPEGWWAEVGNAKIPVNRSDFSIDLGHQTVTFDAVFNALHGTPGEDGLFQAYLSLLNIPHTSSDVFGAALTFNKAECNVLLKGMGYPTPHAIYHQYGQPLDVEEVIAQLGLPLFVKPSRSGSSFGVSKVKHPADFANALAVAAKEDHHILIEAMLTGTEVSCGVFNKHGRVEAIAVTEIVPEGEFFDFQAKYEGRSQEITPARISAQAYAAVCKIAERVYAQLNLNGLARIDFFVGPDDTITLVEINSVPGLSNASSIPQQLRHRGWSTAEVFTTLVSECIQKHEQK